jgi:hypothetical protein
MPQYNLDARLAAPTQRHTMTKSAEAARQAVRSFAVRKKAEKLVTRHGDTRAPVEHPIPRNATTMRKTAEALGFEVRIVHGWQAKNAGQVNERMAPAVSVDGINRKRRVGFRATWVDGKAAFGRWRDVAGWHDDNVTGIAERIGK